MILINLLFCGVVVFGLGIVMGKVLPWLVGGLLLGVGLGFAGESFAIYFDLSDKSRLRGAGPVVAGGSGSDLFYRASDWRTPEHTSLPAAGRGHPWVFG